MVKVAPSLLSANFACLKDDIEKIENGKADWLHYDVMDGQEQVYDNWKVPPVLDTEAFDIKSKTTVVSVL